MGMDDFTVFTEAVPAISMTLPTFTAREYPTISSQTALELNFVFIHPYFKM
jgi:hypothetical protein